MPNTLRRVMGTTNIELIFNHQIISAAAEMGVIYE
jgi:hypothetical protein